MSEEWKDERAECAMREGTEKIMKAAQEKANKEKETLFPEKLEEANKVLSEVGGLSESYDETFEVCIGVGMNQLFPEYIRIKPQFND